MSFPGLINSLLSDTWQSLLAFQPELVLCATIVLILLLRVVGLTARVDSFFVALLGAAVGLWVAAPWRHLDPAAGPSRAQIVAEAPYYLSGPQQASPPDGSFQPGTRVEIQEDHGSYTLVRAADGTRAYVAASALIAVYRQPIFTGMLVYDNFTIYFRSLLLFFAVVFILFTRTSGIPDSVAAPDFYTLVLGALLGMCLMASANHLLIVFLSVEMASVPSYVLAGMLKGRRQSSEAALKYAIYGAGTAGVMLYGISLLAGVLGSVHMPTMAARLAALLSTDIPVDKQMVLALGALMMMVGVAFKLSAVPFHFWCPDVFEGASAEVDAFLSVASKAAALALLVRVALGFGFLPPTAPDARVAGVFSVDDSASPTNVPAAAGSFGWSDVEVPVDHAASAALEPVRDFLAKLLAFVAVITCTFGNLAAYGQTNIKRLLAYSTIAHAGYMIMPVAAAMALAGSNPQGAQSALAALTFYIGVYLFMNLGAFAVVAFLRNVLRSEEIADYAGLIRRAPVTVVCFSILLFSLIGLPPLAGFPGKFLIFASLVDAKLWTVLVVGGLNTALSLFYYLRVVKVMTMDPEPENRLPINLSLIPGAFMVALTLPVVALGLWWNGFNAWAMAAAAHLLS